MNMFCVYSSGSDGRRDPYVVELFSVLVEHIRIALGRDGASEIVSVDDEVLEGLEHGACLPKFIVISGNDDTGKGVKLENGFDEILHQYTV